MIRSLSIIIPNILIFVSITCSFGAKASEIFSEHSEWYYASATNFLCKNIIMRREETAYFYGSLQGIVVVVRSGGKIELTSADLEKIVFPYRMNSGKDFSFIDKQTLNKGEVVRYVNKNIDWSEFNLLTIVVLNLSYDKALVQEIYENARYDAEARFKGSNIELRMFARENFTRLVVANISAENVIQAANSANFALRSAIFGTISPNFSSDEFFAFNDVEKWPEKIQELKRMPRAFADSVAMIYREIFPETPYLLPSGKKVESGFTKGFRRTFGDPNFCPHYVNAGEFQ